MTIADLRAYGANVDEGLARCMNMEAFYLDLVKSALAEDKFDELEAALKEKNLQHAFEICHSLKGVYANLALTPLLNPVSEMTELLRARTDTDYSALLSQAREAYAGLKAIAG